MNFTATPVNEEPEIAQLSEVVKAIPSAEEFRIEKEESRKISIIIFVAGVLILGIVILCLYASSFGMEGFLSTISILTVIALSSAIVGAFIGFIFGIPRTPVTQGQDNIGANTNLEEISDWITKIIVGVSLVQLTEISEGIGEIGALLSDSLGNTSSSYVFSISTLIFYFVGGFFLGYLWSRIFLPKILRKSLEEGRLLKQIEKQKTQLHEYKNALKESKTKQDEQSEIRKQVDDLSMQTDLKNIQKFNPGSFNLEKLENLINDIIEHFDKAEAGNLFSQIILSLYKVGYYDLINKLVDQYSNKINIGYITWTDFAIANMNLYSQLYLPEYKDRMRMAIEKIRQVIPDYGITFAIEIYFNLIQLNRAQATKDTALQEEVLKNIKSLLDETLTKSNLTIFEAINYFKRNERGKWQEYNNLLRKHFAESYNELVKRGEEYRKMNPDYAKIYQSEE